VIARSADRKRQMTKHAHVNELAADLPVRRVHGAVHFIADLTLPYGRVLHD
jgi:acetoacetate decarboxylase